MVSLSTVYVISIVLTSLSGMGSAFVGNKVYPIQGGAPLVIEKPLDEIPKEEEKDTVEQPDLDLKQKIIEKFQVDDDTAQAITEFVQTPVVDWKQIAEDASGLRRKFVKTMTHPDQNKCPPKLLELCKIVYVKYSNMISFINYDSTYVPYGDQTSEAMNLLSSTE